MSDIVTGRIFSNGEVGITALKMNEIISRAVIQPDLIGTKPASSSAGSTDYLLLLKSDNTLAKIAGDAFNASVAAALPLANTTANGALRQVSGLATDYVGGDNQCHPLSSFITKTAATSLTSADTNKYIICSNGSWNLTLPAPAAGLTFFVRNDQTCFGTTGTITVVLTGGTIDGASTLKLLPQQECRIITDGTNWRTFGLKREVVLGTQDITSSTANATVLLPVGFRYFELNWTSIQPATSGDILQARLSDDGGTTWKATGYMNGLVYPSSATAVAYSQSITDTKMILGVNSTTSGQVRTIIYPGSATRFPTWMTDSEGYRTSDSVVATYRGQGLYNASLLANALQYYCAASNIANSFLTVKGVV